MMQSRDDISPDATPAWTWMLIGQRLVQFPHCVHRAGSALMHICGRRTSLPRRRPPTRNGDIQHHLNGCATGHIAGSGPGVDTSCSSCGP